VGRPARCGWVSQPDLQCFSQPQPNCGSAPASAVHGDLSCAGAIGVTGHNQLMPTPLTSLVLYVSDLEKSLRFYTALGLDFAEDDRCEDSPRRLSALLEGEVVLELRTCGDGPPTRTRLGFALPGPSSTGERVGALRYPVIIRRGMLLTARDPDGNTVEMTLASD